EWELRVPPAVWDLARGELEPNLAAGYRYYPPEEFPWPTDLILPGPLVAQIERIAQLVRDDGVRAIVLRGIQGSGRLQSIGAVARGRGVGMITAEIDTGRGAHVGEPANRRWQLLGPLCTMARAIPVVTYDIGPGETAEVAPLVGYRGPLAALMGLEGGLLGP